MGTATPPARVDSGGPGLALLPPSLHSLCLRCGRQPELPDRFKTAAGASTCARACSLLKAQDKLGLHVVAGRGFEHPHVPAARRSILNTFVKEAGVATLVGDYEGDHYTLPSQPEGTLVPMADITGKTTLFLFRQASSQPRCSGGRVALHGLLGGTLGALRLRRHASVCATDKPCFLVPSPRL